MHRNSNKNQKIYLKLLNFMKKVFATLLVVASLAIVSCGPSAEEQAKEKARVDSIAVAKEKNYNDSLAAAKTAEAAKAMEMSAAAHADSIAKGLIKDAKGAVVKGAEAVKAGADKAVEAVKGADKKTKK